MGGAAKGPSAQKEKKERPNMTTVMVSHNGTFLQETRVDHWLIKMLSNGVFFSNIIDPTIVHLLSFALLVL